MHARLAAVVGVAAAVAIGVAGYLATGARLEQARPSDPWYTVDGRLFEGCLREHGWNGGQSGYPADSVVLACSTGARDLTRPPAGKLAGFRHQQLSTIACLQRQGFDVAPQPLGRSLTSADWQWSPYTELQTRLADTQLRTLQYECPEHVDYR